MSAGPSGCAASPSRRYRRRPVRRACCGRQTLRDDRLRSGCPRGGLGWRLTLGPSQRKAQVDLDTGANGARDAEAPAVAVEALEPFARVREADPGAALEVPVGGEPRAVVAYRQMEDIALAPRLDLDLPGRRARGDAVPDGVLE